MIPPVKHKHHKISVSNVYVLETRDQKPRQTSRNWQEPGLGQRSKRTLGIYIMI